MNKGIYGIAIVEGKTEQIFIEKVLAPYLAQKDLFIRVTQVSKAGQKGGDVRFSRVIRDIGLHLKQRQNTFVTLLVDYYGVKEWPGLETLSSNLIPSQIAAHLNAAAMQRVIAEFEIYQPERRFIPYIAMYEFEALLFSNSKILAAELAVEPALIERIISQCREPEAINNGRTTAPSKRLDKLSDGKFAKITKGIPIAQSIGIDKMREQCPIFNLWIEQFESLLLASA